MKFINIAALIVCVATNQALAGDVTFNAAPPGVKCGSGTNITCTGVVPGKPCKGNFGPVQASIVVTNPLANCHIALYSKDNQAPGSEIVKVETNVAGTCVSTDPANFKSYGVYC